MNSFLKLLLIHGLDGNFFDDYRVAANGYGHIAFFNVVSFEKLANRFGHRLRIVDGSIFDGAVGNISNTESFQLSTTLGL